MDSLGDKLRSRREEKNLTTYQAAKETKISQHYIEAFEDDEFSQFSSGTQLVGFLRIYAECLGLNPDRAVLLYRKTLLQEQPSPIKELLQDKKKGHPLPWKIAGICIGVAAIFLWVVINNRDSLVSFFRPSKDSAEFSVIAVTEAMTQRDVAGRGRVHSPVG